MTLRGSRFTVKEKISFQFPHDISRLVKNNNSIIVVQNGEVSEDSFNTVLHLQIV